MQGWPGPKGEAGPKGEKGDRGYCSGTCKIATSNSNETS